MSLLNLFGSDASDSIQSSRFAANLRKATYDPLLITFNSIRTGKKKDTANKDAKGLTTPTTPSISSTHAINILSQKMVLASSFDSLDAAQRQTQRESTCDYVVFVPTSFEINKDAMNAFYDSKLKQLFKRKTEFDNAAANIFLNWSMFESFVIFANKKVNERQIALIEKSFDSAKKEMDKLINATKYAVDFSKKPVNVSIELNELWEIMYVMNDVLPDRLQSTSLVLKRMLNHFYVYTNAIVLFDGTTSVGRIPNYLPLLNSNMPVSYRGTPINDTEPSRNIEVMTAFLMGIMTNKKLSNRSELRSDKLKAIRDKTYLCTFKSTTDDSLNYETLLKRLYYKFPCFLTPSLMVPREKITQMCDDVLSESIGDEFDEILKRAVSKMAPTTNACNLICAVAVATYVHIMLNVDFTASNGVINKALDDIHADTVSVDTNLTPLLEPARAVANSVWAAAKHQTSFFTSETKFRRRDVVNAMEQVMFDQCNFASFMYNNATLLSLMEYSDQAPVHENAPKHADYLKTFYKSLANGVDASAKLKEQDEFNQFNDEMLYIIHGPLYFDYEWIFRQDPSLIRHILGEELLPAQDSTTSTSIKEQSQWIPRVDPLTENVHYINRNPPPNYPKMRFDNPTPLPNKTESRMDYTDPRYAKKTWKELYVSPEQARAENQLETMKEAVNNAATMTGAITALTLDFENWNKCTAGAKTAIDSANQDEVNAMYNWTTPGYYRYELTATQNLASTNEQLTYRFMQLMRPVEPGAIQDYTEPNLPTAYPAPLMFITPPMRGPTNSFMLHTWIPDLSSEISPSYSKFITAEPNGKKTLNRGAYMEQLYKMMQLVFKTVILNARSAGSTSATASSADTKRICVKIMAIGYDGDERNLKMVVSDEDKKFIGDSFFYAVRDYSMFYEANNVNVIVYYDEKTQQEVKQRYNEYTSQRESVLLRMGASTSQSTTIDETLKLQIMPVEDFFTLKFQMGKLQLQEKDLLYFVNYCSTPRAFIGNCGECPNNIEDVVNEEIASLSSSLPSPSPSPLETCLREAQKTIDKLYNARKIPEKMDGFHDNLDQWNNHALPKQMVSDQEKIRDTYVNYKTNRDVINASELAKNPTNVNVSWWMTGDKNAIPRNAYLSSFDEHVLILHNLLERFKSGAVVEFDVSVHVYTQVKKILTLLSKIKPDNIQISPDDIDLVKGALADLTVDMSWSMDAKFTTGVCDGAFIPNSSVLHNPFVCTQLLDINKWQYVDFDDIASREILEAKPLPPLLKKIVDLKIQESQGVSSVSADAPAVNSGILMVSKQPSIAWFMKNVKTIFENLFQKNAPLKIDGKEMVLNNYAWPEEQLYCKMRNDTKLSSFKTGAGRKAIDFAELRGLRSSSSARKCIEFPLFVVQLTLTLFEGKLSDITLLDQASLTCSSDKAMMDSNLKIVWEQMMTNLKAKEQNFTIANVFKRLGFNSVDVEYDYTAYFDANPNTTGLVDASDNPIGLISRDELNGTVTILIGCTNSATNPILKTTNSQKLKTINEEVSDNALTENAKFYNTPPYVPTAELPFITDRGLYNSIRALAQIAEYFNLVEMHGVAGIEIEGTILQEMKDKLKHFSRDYKPQDMTKPGARIGWNAAVQTDSTMLYINPNVMVNGTLQDISTYLLTLKPGDKILIKTDTDKAKYRKDCIDATVRLLKRWGERKGMQLTKFLLYVVYGLSFCLGLVAVGTYKGLIELGKGLLNIVKKGTMVSGVVVGTGATGILALAVWLPTRLIVAIIQGIINIVKKIKNRRANAGAAGVAAPVAPVAPVASVASGDDDDDNDLSDLESAVGSVGDLGESSVGEEEAVEEGLTILQKYLAKSETYKNAFIDYVKSAYKKSIKNPFETDFRGLPKDVRVASESFSKPIAEKAREINAGLNTQKAEYNDQNTADKALAIEAFERCFEKTQMWMITGSPARNPGLSNKVINIPVYHFRLRAYNLTNPFGEQIANDTKLKVEFQKFSKDD
jgi:hypothetical protein